MGVVARFLSQDPHPSAFMVISVLPHTAVQQQKTAGVQRGDESWSCTVGTLPVTSRDIAGSFGFRPCGKRF